MASKVARIWLTVVLFFTGFGVSFSSNIILNDYDWQQILENEWLIKFYAPWCPACRQLESTWEELAQWAGHDNTFLIGSVDVTEQPALNGRFMITSLPTIYHVKDGIFRKYSSSRSLVELKKFILDEEWREIAPASGWTSPTSALMNGISKMFSLSTSLKSFHESLSTEYGLPGWASLALFGLAIIVIGLLGGILLVFISDWIWGPPTYPEHYTALGERDEREEEGTDEKEEEPHNSEDSKDANNDKSKIRKRKVVTKEDGDSS